MAKTRPIAAGSAPFRKETRRSRKPPGAALARRRLLASATADAPPDVGLGDPVQTFGVAFMLGMLKACADLARTRSRRARGGGQRGRSLTPISAASTA